MMGARLTQSQEGRALAAVAEVANSPDARVVFAKLFDPDPGVIRAIIINQDEFAGESGFLQSGKNGSGQWLDVAAFVAQRDDN